MEEKTKLNMQMYDAESILAPLQKLNLMDDFLFDAATGDLETCRIIIELSLGIRIRNIAWKEGQKVIRNLPGNRGSGWISMWKMTAGVCLMLKCRSAMREISPSVRDFIRH